MYCRGNTFSSISGGIVLIGLALAVLLGRGDFFLPIFFVALAFAALFGSLSSGNPRAVYGGLQGFFWLLGLAFCFLVGFWPWILVVAGISVILGGSVCSHHLRIDWNRHPGSYTRLDPAIPGLNRRKAKQL